jgi:Protein of unknown function DUF262
MARSSRKAGVFHKRDSRLQPGKDILAIRPEWRRKPDREGRMHYRNAEMKLDQLIGYFNGKKINLIPPFQRGHVWKLPHRRRLLENMVTGRPIPAVFLYKEAAGSQFAYNILDGKQRLESLILFIGNARDDMRVERVREYFANPKEKRQANFSINLEGKKQTFKQLTEERVREFREYAIPTIEIDLDDESSLDEIINLFVDINQQGEKVKRFDIVKAIGTENPLLKSVFKLVAQQKIKKQDKQFKKKSTVFTHVLSKLQIVQNAADVNQKVDRMWERLVEVVLFCRTKAHRQPGQILKAFIKTDDKTDTKAVTPQELKKLRTCFTFLDKCYKETDLGNTRLARDLPFFYTMVTALLASDMLEADGAPPDYPTVRKKLLAFAALLDKSAVPLEISDPLKQYKQAAVRQTTHPGQRKIRQDRFIEILNQL